MTFSSDLVLAIRNPFYPTLLTHIQAPSPSSTTPLPLLPQYLISFYYSTFFSFTPPFTLSLYVSHPPFHSITDLLHLPLPFSCLFYTPSFPNHSATPPLPPSLHLTLSLHLTSSLHSSTSRHPSISLPIIPLPHHSPSHPTLLSSASLHNFISHSNTSLPRPRFTATEVCPLGSIRPETRR